MNMKLLSPDIIVKLFGFLICPIILLYGCEVWEPCLNQNVEKWNSNSIEKVHLDFMKRLLGVNRSTTNALVTGELEVNRSTANALVTGELGRYSLQEKFIIIKYEIHKIC